MPKIPFPKSKVSRATADRELAILERTYPHAATAEKGRQLIDLVVARLAPFLVELSKAKVDDKFPF